MIIKQKLYSITLVSVVMTLMLISTASAARFGDVTLKTDPCTQSVDFLKFPVCGCDSDSCDNCRDKDKGKCLEPFLTGTIHKEKDKNGQTDYNYKVINTGDTPLKGLAVLGKDGQTFHHALAPGEGVEFQTLQPLHLSK